MEDYRVTQTGDEIQEILNQSPLDTASIAELEERLSDVEGKIPSEASEDNQLADKKYVDDSISDTADELTSLINGKANAADVYTKSETYNKTELDSMITTPDVQYVSVTATAMTTAVTDVLPATGAADTIYRIGSWDGTQYDAASYSEYAWNGTAYVLLNVKDAGIATGSDFDNPTAAQRALLTTVGAVLDGCDATPTAGSVKPVQSGGVYNTELDNLNRISEEPIYISKTYSITSEGTFGTNNTYSHAVVPVTEDECYLLTNLHPSTDTLRYVFAVSEDMGVNREIDMVDGTTVHTVNHGQTDIINIPAGCNYLLFNSLPDTLYLPHLKKVRDMSKAMDMQAVELFGAGDALVASQKLYNVKGGNTYRVWVKNPNISLDGISYTTSTYKRFQITCYDANGTALGDVASVSMQTTTPLKEKYDFLPIEGTAYIQINMRAKVEEEQMFVLEDITALTALEHTLPRIAMEGTYSSSSQSSVSTEPVGSFLAGHTYRLWLKDTGVFPTAGVLVLSVYAYNNPNKDYSSSGCARVRIMPLIYGNDTILPYYDCYLPTTVEKEEEGETVTINVKEWWIVANNRVNKGDMLDIRIEDITYPNSCKVEVVNNLKSESETSALSAKQGKILGDAYDSLSADIYGGSFVEKTVGKDELDKTEVKGAFSTSAWTYGQDSKASSYKIPLALYIEEGYNYIHITPREDLSAYYTFTKAELPATNVSLDALRSTYLSAIMDGNIRFKIAAGSGDTRLEIPNDNSLYLYITRHFFSSDYYNEPTDYSITEEHDHPSIIDEKIESSVGKTLGIAVKPVPPALINIKINNDGSITKADNILTSGIIFGNFTCKLKEGYAFNRVMRVDTAGNIVDYNYATESLPPSVMDSSGNNTGTTNRSVFGAGFTPFEYGLILEVTSDLSKIDKETSSVFEYFFWSDDLTSELATLPRFNGDNYTDSDTDSDRIYTKASIASALKRAKIAAMIPWEPLKYVMPTQSSYRDIRFMKGALLYGIPYSRANVRDRWFGLCVSPETFLTALENPYSVIYTERIGNNSNDYPFASEYGIASYGSTHGVPYYGLVCSAYASYVLGFDEAISTDSFPATSRLYIFSKHSAVQSGAGIIASPVDARTIPALSTVTTPGHTYLVVDFYVIDGERVAALVAEETSPMIKVAFYPIDRLQERFDYEYNYYCTADGGASIADSAKIIETNVIKPSQLDNRKNNNMWDVSALYSTQTEKELLLGMCKPDIHIDEHIMFYMGEKAVVMEYDAGAVKNDRQWLIVSPDDYTKIKVEKWDESNDQWTVVASNYDIDSHKESYSDQNLNYFKVDITELCPTYGKYRACLVGDNNEQTGYTQWIVLNCTIMKDPNDATKIIWETVNSSLSSESDLYATAVAAGFCNSAGASAIPLINEGNAISRHYIEITQSHADYVKVRIKCKWGCGTRYVSYSSL